MDEGSMIFILIMYGVFLQWSHFFTTWDSDIIKGNKIKIQNAVYQCEKKQELDLK